MHRRRRALPNFFFESRLRAPDSAGNAALNWGTGTVVRVSIELRVENDCVITAPDLDFGSAPLTGSFSPVTRTILIRCSAGAGLDDGLHPLGSTRRMRSGSNYLPHDIYKTSASPDRWGAVGAARRDSMSADSGSGVYDSVSSEAYTYRAEVLPGPRPPQGSYGDTIRIDVDF